ncbi:D-methionine transport system substrate-binding protein [Ancylobacter sp. 3268]|uniref:MetQ/NlpA family ABC transporter substrate-binding protein n=1 Tax=Ancylobacter sp. 3268 TaxID=2817752 RepID=UPI0028566BE7|nr:MetQ/NlpA family ABC transporter substrate-binding protein [Ancylobacter sp. 3268]MDR6953113.1 D-methionine transport system substrate-binding protein [Ancylobacter sp. 3268]
MTALNRRWLGLGLGATLAAFTILPAHADEKAATDRIKLGVIGGDEEEIAEVAKKVAAKAGLEIEVVTFSDYTLPNEALSRGDLDANAFQHKPYLDAQIAARGYRIVPAGFTIVEPIGFYSLKIKDFKDLPEGAQIGIPNDPSNGGRALNLLAANGLITLAPGKGLQPTVLDVTGNPKKVKLRELDAALLPKQLADLDGAVINTNYALGAKLDPRKDALVQESRTDNPYGNFIAVRAGDEGKPAVVKLVKAYQSQEVKDFLGTRFKGAILPAW